MLRFLVRAAILVVVLYLGVAVGYPYYQYVMMKRAVEEAADAGVPQLEAMRKARWEPRAASREVTAAVTILIQARATRLGLQLPAEAVQVLLEPDLLRVLANWEAEVRVPGYAQRLPFRVEGKRVLVR